jgi:3-oxoacyl-[acyl-carrier-protein] synthase-3
MKRYGNIIGWGSYVPSRVVTNADLEKTLATSHEWIVERTGIHERRIVGEAETSSSMSIAAAKAALDKAGIRAKDLDLIIVATSSPDYLTPPISSQVQHELGAKKIGAFTLVTGCTGFLYALATAQQFIASGASETILIIGTELLSRFIDWEDRATCVLFGDGSGAVVMQATETPSGVLSYLLGSDGSVSEHLILPAGGSVHPPSQETLDNRMHYVKMNGRAVFKFATRVLGKALRQVIAQAGLTADDIDLFIPHQANARIISSAARQAGLPEEKIFLNIHKYGNTSAASIPIALTEALDEGRAKVGDTLAFVAFGAGLTWASAVVKIVEHEKPQRLPWWRGFWQNWFQRNGQEIDQVDLESAPEELSGEHTSGL